MEIGKSSPVQEMTGENPGPFWTKLGMRYRTISDIFSTKNLEQAKKNSNTILKTGYMSTEDTLRWSGTVMAGEMQAKVFTTK